jgi:hypothetical protein
MFAGFWRIAAAAASAVGCWGWGEGWLHASLAVIGMDSDDNCNGNCLRKKGVRQGRRRGGIERWVHFFMLSYFIIIFGLPFSMQVDWFLIKIKSIVGQASLARILFQSSKFGHHISVKQL